MGSGLSNFSDTGLTTVFGTPVTAASLLDPDVRRIDRLTALATLGLRDLQTLLERVGVDRVPLMIGVASDLDEDERRGMRNHLVDAPGVLTNPAWYPYGRASTFAALDHAARLVADGSHRFIAVAGIDSLCAPDSVQRLLHLRRILGPHTEGTIPGEAAVFALVSRADDPAANSAHSVLLEAVAERRAAVPFTEVTRVSGDDLAALFRSFRERGLPRSDRVIAAHSGEGYFGRSFAYAYLREMEVMPEPLEVELIADCVGDVGAAAGTLGLAFAIYRMATQPRGTRGRALVYSESDTGELGAAIIDGAPTSWDDTIA
jgi:3-oxoacyl-[acyl-carrier-protein] synthase-1